VKGEQKILIIMKLIRCTVGCMMRMQSLDINRMQDKTTGQTTCCAHCSEIQLSTSWKDLAT